MALQSSGTITLAQIASEFGGGQPHALGEYYKNGSYVPSSITVNTTVREPSSGEMYNRSGDQYIWEQYGGYGSGNYARWNGTKLFETSSGTFTTYTSNGWTYYRGTHREQVTQMVQGPQGPMPVYIERFGIYRKKGGTSTQTINQNIPTSGPIRFSDFYEGRKS